MSKLIDLTGKKFNRLTVIERIENNKHNQSQWICKCDCGNMVVVVAAHLKDGHTKSCGCIRSETSHAIDLTGQRFGRLTVIEREDNKGKKTMWKCRCDCGNEKVLRSDSLKSGRSKSCGCYNIETSITANKSHGRTGTRLYNIWSLMKDRCINPNNKAYKNYGGRGIKVCEEWMHDFQAFYDWAIYHGYRDDLTIDRIDNDGNYEPGNCRWATQKVQQNNRRNNHLLTYNGETHTIAEWAEIYGINEDVLRVRINNNWSFERAITQEIAKRNT